MKQRFIDLYMDFAKRVAKMSYAKRLQVGAVIVKDDTVISYGYNGTPAGWDNNCENIEFMPYDLKHIDPTEIWHQWPFEGKFWINGELVEKRYRLKTKPEVLHAESNAISKLAKSANGGLGADIFITHAPCMDCAKLIYQSGIRRVFFNQNYRDDSGIEFLKKSNIEVNKISQYELTNDEKL
jgi:dCMP deaminase